MRRYGRWAGRPLGTPEDLTRCIATVYSDNWHTHKCRYKRGKGPDGLFCGVHAKQIERGTKPFVPPDEDSNEAST